MDGWRLISDNPELGVRHYELEMDNMTVIRTEHYAIPAFMEANKALYDASDGQRWGEGKVAARIPLSVLYGELAEPMREGDKDYIKKFLNDFDNRGYRTFKGQL